MAYPPLAASRRPRRRGRVAILIILGLIAAIIALAVRYRTERRDSVDYLAAAKEVSDEHAVLAAALANLFASLPDLERPAVLDTLADLAADSSGLLDRLEATTVTSAVGEANGYFLVAAASWDRALGSLSGAVIEVLDAEGDGRAGDAMLTGAFEDLRVGDRAYAMFRESLSRVDPELVTREYLDFGYTAGERDGLYDAPLVAERLRSTLQFVENRDVSVRAATDPEPLGTDNGVRVVPDSESFSVQVVVTNEGNVSAELITVMLVLHATGDDSPQQRSEIVPVLQPGQATTVMFDDLTVTAGMVYQLQVVADVADDDVPDNNTWELLFTRNAP